MTAAVNPTTGLHNTTNLTDHDSTITGGSGTACEKCHDDTTTVSTGHQNGTLEDSAAVTYNWNTTNIAAGYVRATDDCAASCHSDGATWNREWSGVTDVSWAYTDDASAAAVCGNCHGSFAEGWNIVGETSHVNPDADNNPNTLDADPARSGHTECTLCHGWDDGGGNYQTGTRHINTFITMNSDVGYTDTGDINSGCSINCHDPLTLTMSGASGWTGDTVSGGAPACGSCHTDGVQTGSSSATHTAHGATSADLVGGGPWPDCVQCHPDVNYDSAHSGALQFANVTYSGGENGTCTTSSCHNQGAEESNAWDSATQLE
ncbi:MAG: hypothetical protein GWM88_17635, partial [Pseudomonadales bacterium]|nr:hypothetical protein [Pseudomonadales bacterium]NIX09755.1 hypothetical protein [Pseudomonadales bacterium]